ncbi:MAG: response regulator [Desulfobulbaceae bacterium]|nr:response regulator [Desulfobulbaceae bacterium]
MRAKIIIAFGLIFTLFLAGSGITVYNLVTTSNRLSYLIGLHEIEDIRQELFSSIQRVSSYVFATPDVFADHLDEILLNTNTMHKAIRRCNDCHHAPGVQQDLDETQQLADRLEKQLGHLTTTVADNEQRHAIQTDAYHASSEILDKVQTMVNVAALTIDRRTEKAMKELHRVYFLVGATLLAALILALLIARHLTKSITAPIDELVNSTRKIADGHWGHQTDFQTTGEFQELIEAFNRMSESLAHKREQEKLHIKRLQDTRKQLVEAEKLTALGTLAGGIAHDFNNILCAMIGHLNILAKQIPQEEKYLKTIATIEKAGFRAADLVKQLLTFARQKPMVRQDTDINKCINDVVQLISNTFDKLIKLNLDLSEQLPAVSGDGAQLEQVIINLCVNARDAMPEGGEISIRTELFEPDQAFRDQHQEARQRPYVLLTVQDTGYGINEKILPRIFDPFFTTKEVGKGTGLGLAMVYGIVQNHEGLCTIASVPGQGTTVKIYLPAIEPQTGKSVLSPSSSLTPTGKTILIVDDEPMVAAMLKTHLESLGCKTMTAENGRIAVDLLRDNKDRIDLIILDINMPVMCGRDAYQHFMRIRPDIPVLVSTGYIMDEDTMEILNMGAQGLLQKPYTMKDVNARIMEIFSRDYGG